MYVYIYIYIYIYIFGLTLTAPLFHRCSPQCTMRPSSIVLARSHSDGPRSYIYIFIYIYVCVCVCVYTFGLTLAPLFHSC